MLKSRRQALGQHFLVNPGVLQKIVQAISPNPDELIIEVGAGKGILSIPLAEKAGKVIAIEKDGRLAAGLRGREVPNLEIVESDVLKIDFRKLIGKEKRFTGQVKLIGNLPYSISSPLLFRVLEHKTLFTGCVFLLQKEVAERISATPGSKKYAPLSILFQISFETRLLFAVSPGSFCPPPKVDSALVSLQRRPAPLFKIVDEVLFQKFLRGAFAQRRKILSKNLENLGFLPNRIEDAYRRFQIGRLARPEELAISQFVELFNCLSAPPPGVA
jgi:16S rRNA (adenine1518-N6/adenine1519-N6)-dimethyltransferase